MSYGPPGYCLTQFPGGGVSGDPGKARSWPAEVCTGRRSRAEGTSPTRASPTPAPGRAGDKGCCFVEGGVTQERAGSQHCSPKSPCSIG